MAKTGSHQGGCINTTMRQLGKPIGVATTKGLIDAGQEDERKGRIPTKNTMDLGNMKPADINGPMGTSVKFRK